MVVWFCGCAVMPLNDTPVLSVELLIVPSTDGSVADFACWSSACARRISCAACVTDGFRFTA